MTIVVALFAGVVGSVLVTMLRSRHERRADLRGKILDRGSEFSGRLQATFGQVMRAIDARAAEPDEEDEFSEGDDHDDDDVDPRTLWSPETVRAYDSAEEAFMRAESALSPLLLLIPEECVAVRAANEAISMLSTAIGALREPDDETAWSRLYLLHAQLSWAAFNRAIRREVSRAGRRVLPWTYAREVRGHRAWLLAETEKRTVDPGESGIHVMS